MSTSVTPSGTTIRPGRSGRFLGVIAAGMAVVIAIGIVVAVNQGPETAVPAVQSETASARWQDRSDFMQQQYAEALSGAQAASIGATIDGLQFAVNNAERALNIADQQLEAYLKLHAGSGAVNGSDVRFKGLEELLTQPAPAVQDGSDVHLGGVAGLLLPPVSAIQDASDVRFEGMKQLLTDRAHAEQQATWDQRYDDMVERFENQSDGGTGLTPLRGRY